MNAGEITALVVSVSTALPAVAAFILALRHGEQIKANTKRVDLHDVQISRLTPAAPHEKHCASTEQIHRALRVQNTIHKHHEPPKP